MRMKFMQELGLAIVVAWLRCGVRPGRRALFTEGLPAWRSSERGARKSIDAIGHERARPWSRVRRRPSGYVRFRQTQCVLLSLRRRITPRLPSCSTAPSVQSRLCIFRIETCGRERSEGKLLVRRGRRADRCELTGVDAVSTASIS